MTDFTAIDAALVATLTDIAEAQKAHVTSHGKYQQMDATAGPEGTDIAVSEYVSPLGVGYVVEVSKVIEGEEWRCVLGFGPEARDVAWFRVGG